MRATVLTAIRPRGLLRHTAVSDPVSTELARVVAEEVTPEIAEFMSAVTGSSRVELGELFAEQIRA